MNCRDVPEVRDGYFMTYYTFNKLVLDIITEKFDIQVDIQTTSQAALLHSNIPGYDLPTINFTSKIKEEQDKGIHIFRRLK